MSRKALAKLSAQTGVVDSGWDANLGTVEPSGGDPVRSLAISEANFETNLFVGGNFSGIGGTDIAHAAKLSTTGSGAVDPAWRPAPYSAVSAIAAKGKSVYMAMQNPCRAELGCVSGRLTRTSVIGNGAPDPSWQVEVGPDDFYAFVGTLVLTDSSVLIGSSLATVNGEVSLGIMKLDQEKGARDPGFSAHAQTPGSVKAIARQPDGKVIIGGDFWFVSGLPRQNLARVSTNGTLDTAWAPRPTTSSMRCCSAGVTCSWEVGSNKSAESSSMPLPRLRRSAILWI
ncbi:MAG: delta-60 repeat domain-containing protein [Verrucomicrobiae bacterium]|nr:delta-60 repeat domain-containing protein [Verrucomicrobiae bacterium]